MRTAFLLRPLALAACMACVSTAHAQAMPHGATVINGTAVVNAFSNGLQVVNSPGAIIQWDSFSIGNGRTVRFDQLTSQSAVLNRVTGGSYSEILGTLQSNGRVFLLNPNGIVFGAGSVVDTAGLLASTLDISNEDFLAGNYRFRCFNARVCESGVDVLNPYNNRIVLKDGSRITTRTAGEGGQVWLIARDRITSEKGSKIDTPSGQAMLAAAQEVTITSPALGQMSFTLTGTAGSRIDLEGDIDARRGAAGFFADAVRLAGGVRAYSDVDGAGQIVAEATSTVSVEGDARLSVSAYALADAGAIRLHATQRVSVAPSVEISADGGVYADGLSGGRGGLIELRAAEVLLPGLQGEPHEGPMQLHARGADTRGLSYDRYGVIDIQETGNFTYTLVNGPSFTQAEQSTANSRVEQRTSSARGTDSKDNTSIMRVVPGTDGGYMLLTVRSEVSSEYSTTQPAQPANFAEVTAALTYMLHMVDAQGTVTRTHTLSAEQATASGTSTPLNDRYFTPVALTKGGWVILEAERSQLTFVPLNGNVVTVAVGANASVQALLGGGVLVRNRAVATQVYDAQGVLSTTPNAVLANESLVRSNETSVQRHNYDERFRYRLGTAGDLEYYRADTGVAAGSLGPLPAYASSGVAMLGDDAWISVATDANRTASNAGIFSDGNFAPMLQSHYTSTNSRVGTRTTASSESVQISRVRALNNASMYIETTTSQDSSRSDYVPATVITRDAESQRSATVTSGLLVRSLSNTPFAATGATAQLAAPLQLASLPGVGNGTREGGGGVIVVPPVDPGTPLGGSGDGSSGSADPSRPAPRLELPPPPRPLDARPASATSPASPDAAAPPIGVPAAQVNAPPLSEEESGVLEAARDFVRGELGPRGLAKLDAAKTPAERAAVIADARFAHAIGPELYEAVESLGDAMQFAILGVMSELQVADGLNNRDLSEGLMKALTVKRETRGADGAPGEPRTRLDATLKSLDKQLAEAGDSPEGKARVKALLMREMVIASRQEEGDTVDTTGDIEIVSDKQSRTRITPAGEVVRDGPPANGGA